MHEAPLVLAVLSGKKYLSVLLKGEHDELIEKAIPFVCLKEDDLIYEATVPTFVNKKQTKLTSILLDFDALEGMSDILLLFSAFIAPKETLLFSITNEKDSKVASYQVFTTIVEGIPEKAIKKIA